MLLVKCTECNKNCNPFDVGKDGAYFNPKYPNNKKHIVCFDCFTKIKSELHDEFYFKNHIDSYPKGL